MYSELEDSENSIYINILKKSTDYKTLLNFENFEGYITKTSITKIRKALTNFIQNIKHDKISRILPILVSSKFEKVRLLDLIEVKLQDARMVYVPSPPASEHIFYHIYNCLIEELGLNILDEISNKIQTENVRRSRCVRAIIDYIHNEEKKNVVMRWFLGEKLSNSEKNMLGFKDNIEADDISLEMIKLIGNFSNEVILLYFDDIELPYTEFGEFAERKFLETLKRLNRDVKQLIIILICSRNSWPKILKLADQTLSSILGPEMEFYDLSEVKKLISSAMDEYWLKNDIKPPINQFFPLNEKLINEFFKQSDGEIRPFLKAYIEGIRKIISGEISI
ncbi:MAG: hypothetical protein ACFFBW_10700 [Promethearchaeota archaeon]